ncbi:MAG TPA: methytransferase partner Trm112 [Methanomassiliicoccaceae archaeon]|nr:Trm112 family protein [Euryarchaeota archaeon]HOB39174.1 methytransferase partner Trm112 [Methanomassiliicoccaceae archaeon]HOQ25640.1 methytransferase partner Trm112 [Methanomassiliicoccaceae archaeon]HPP44936.1 methytransferase partner Trm112 [Methanomassiliicoccaceae archaeon]HPT74268.1 methytransferase partner Trm112 [Methanomassiliicoccaceae archaeon]
MKKDLLDILACPNCRHHPLELTASRMDGDDVEEGTLTCTSCGAIYPIAGSIPDMLPPQDR